VSGDVTLAELYGALSDRELFVEPLSATQPLASFLAQGGIGYGSQGHGTFAGQLCELKASYGGLPFTYGLGTAPLYNTGYPLQRIAEGASTGSTYDHLEKRFGDAEEMVARARPVAGRKVAHAAGSVADLPRAFSADVIGFFVNGAAAKAMGLPGTGVATATRAEGAGDEAWSKRFVLDTVPSGHEKLLVLTQPSGAKALEELHSQKSADGVFLALNVHIGVLVAASAAPAALEELAAKAKELPLTWRMGA
jgi:hypothetical protein